MLNAPTTTEALAAAVLLVVCSLGIWHRAYEDTVTQRVGLALTACASALLLGGVLLGMETRPALSGTLIGCAIFAFGCFLKYRKVWLAFCKKEPHDDAPG